MLPILGVLGDISVCPRDAAMDRWPTGSLDRYAHAHKHFRLLQTADALVSDSELLEMTLFRVVSPKRICSVVEALLAQFETFAGTVAASTEDLRNIRGLGRAGIITLKTVPLAAERLANLEDVDRLRLESPTKLYQYLSAKLCSGAECLLFIVYLNAKNRVIAEEIEVGPRPFASPIDKRRFLQTLLSHYATGIILAHYRPDRDANPAPYDHDVIKMIKFAVGPLSVVLQDYIVIGKTRWISFQREGLL